MPPFLSNGCHSKIYWVLFLRCSKDIFYVTRDMIEAINIHVSISEPHDEGLAGCNKKKSRANDEGLKVAVKKKSTSDVR